MRWERLFDDLEAQLASVDQAEFASEVSDRTRTERATVVWVERLRAQGDAPVDVTLLDGSAMAGRVVEAADRWLLLATGRSETLITVTAVVTVRGLTGRVGRESTEVEKRLGVGRALRTISRDRAAVRLRTTVGELVGTIDGVGKDYLDLAEHPLDAPRRAAAVTHRTTVLFSQLICVTRVGDDVRW